MANKATTAKTAHNPTNRTMVRASNRAEVNRVASKAINKAKIRMATTRMARTNNNKVGPNLNRASKAHNQINNRDNSLITRTITATTTMMEMGFQTMSTPMMTTIAYLT